MPSEWDIVEVGKPAAVAAAPKGGDWDIVQVGVPGLEYLGGLPPVPGTTDRKGRLVGPATVEPVSKWGPVLEAAGEVATKPLLAYTGGYTATEAYDRLAGGVGSILQKTIGRGRPGTIRGAAESNLRFVNELVRGLPELADFATTPLGAATVASQGAPMVLRAAMNAAFATDMGKQALAEVQVAWQNPNAENTGRAAKATVMALLPFLHAGQQELKNRRPPGGGDGKLAPVPGMEETKPAAAPIPEEWTPVKVPVRSSEVARVFGEEPATLWQDVQRQRRSTPNPPAPAPPEPIPMDVLLAAMEEKTTGARGGQPTVVPPAKPASTTPESSQTPATVLAPVPTAAKTASPEAAAARVASDPLRTSETITPVPEASREPVSAPPITISPMDGPTSSELGDVRAVLDGRKPAANIGGVNNPELMRAVDDARRRGFRVVRFDNSQYEGALVGLPGSVQELIRLHSQPLIEQMQPEWHIAFGRALGYSEKSIARFVKDMGPDWQEVLQGWAKNPEEMASYEPSFKILSDTHSAVANREPLPPGKEAIQPKPSEAAAGGEGAATLPGSIAEMSPHEIQADPVRFQFKRDTGGKAGVGEELKGVQTWNPELGGIMSVWRDPADGKTYVTNGHHRLDLAKRTDAPKVLVRYIEAKDAMEARAKGALQNIAEGRGTSIDAAKFIRDSGYTLADMERNGVSPKGAVAREGVALSRLPEALFDQVISGEMPAKRAAILGESLENPADMTAAADLLWRAEKGGKRLTDSEVKELVRRVQGAERRVETTQNLFGEEEFVQNLALEEAQISDYIRQRLSKEKKLFATAGSESAAQQLGAVGNVIDAAKNRSVSEQAAQAQAVYDKLSLSAGPIPDAVREGARRLADGESEVKVREDVYGRVRQAVQDLIGGRERPSAPGVEAVAAGGRASEAAAGVGTGGLWDEIDASGRADVKQYGVPGEGSFWSSESGVQADPRLALGYLKIGIAKMGRGVTDFATWSAEMLREFGEEIRPHLERVYLDAQRGAAALKDLNPDEYLNFNRLAISDESKKALRGRVLETVIRTGRFPKERESRAEVIARARELGIEDLKQLKPYQESQAEFRALVFAGREQVAAQNEAIFQQRLRLKDELDNFQGSASEKAELMLKREREIDAMERDARELLNVGMRTASEHGRNLSMYNAMAADEMRRSGTANLFYWISQAKKAMGLPASVDLPDKQHSKVSQAVAGVNDAVKGASNGKGGEALAPVPGISGGETELPGMEGATVPTQGGRILKAVRSAVSAANRKTENILAGKDPNQRPGALTPEERAIVDNDPRVIAARRRLAQVMAEMHKTGALEAVSALRKAGLLTGIKTHLRNVGGNTVFQVMEEVSRLPGAAADMALSLYTGTRTVQGMQPRAFAHASYYAATKGVHDAREIWKHGMTEDQLAKMVDIPREVNTGNRYFDGYVNHVFRLMSAEDRAFKAYAMQRSLQEQAWIISKREGKSYSDLLNHPTEAMQVQAVADAEFATFNNKNILASKLRQAQHQLSNEGAAGKAAAFAIDIAVPFANTPANIMFRMFDYTPLGGIRAGHAAYKAAVNKALSPAEQRTISLSIGRGLTGTALLYMGWKLAEAGLATGMRSKQEGERNVDEAAGRAPGAVLAGGSWRQVAPFSPLGNLIVLGATMFHDRDKGATAVASGGARTVLEQPMLKGVNDALEALKSPDRSAANVASSVAGSFVPTLVADVAGAIDTTRRSARPETGGEALYKGIQSRIPGLRSALPPRHDVLGRPMEQPASQAVDPTLSQSDKAANDPVVQALVANDVKVGWPERHKYDAPMTPEDEAALAAVLDPILNPLPVEQDVKDAAWKAFYKSSNPDEFKARFEVIGIPPEAKAALWDARFTSTEGTPPLPSEDKKNPRTVNETAEEYRVRSILVGRLIELRVRQELEKPMYQRAMPGEDRRERLDRAIQAARTEASVMTTKSGKYQKADLEGRLKILEDRIRVVDAKINRRPTPTPSLAPVPGTALPNVPTAWTQ